MIDNPLVSIVVAIFVVASVTMLLHERHYQSRTEQILEGRITVLEKIISESRGL